MDHAWLLGHVRLWLCATFGNAGLVRHAWVMVYMRALPSLL